MLQGCTVAVTTKPVFQFFRFSTGFHFGFSDGKIQFFSPEMFFFPRSPRSICYYYLSVISNLNCAASKGEHASDTVGSSKQPQIPKYLEILRYLCFIQPEGLFFLHFICHFMLPSPNFFPPSPTTLLQRRISISSRPTLFRALRRTFLPSIVMKMSSIKSLGSNISIFQ